MRGAIAVEAGLVGQRHGGSAAAALPVLARHVEVAVFIGGLGGAGLTQRAPVFGALPGRAGRRYLGQGGGGQQPGYGQSKRTKHEQKKAGLAAGKQSLSHTVRLAARA